jgi:hypothetical protein
MIVPGELDITVWQGASYIRSFQLQDSAGVNIATTGWTARMQIRDTYSASTTRLSVASGDGYISINGTGLVSLALTPAQTAAIPGGTVLVYDIEVVNGAVVYRILMGRAIISPEVTR